MTAVDDIFAAACQWAKAEQGEEEMLLQLCAAAEQRLRGLLLEGTDVNEIYDSFVTAAGLLAAADFSALRAGAEVHSFSAGPVSVTRNDGNYAENLRQQAMLIMGPWCQDGFRFLGVRG